MIRVSLPGRRWLGGATTNMRLPGFPQALTFSSTDSYRYPRVYPLIAVVDRLIAVVGRPHRHCWSPDQQLSVFKILTARVAGQPQHDRPCFQIPGRALRCLHPCTAPR